MTQIAVEGGHEYNPGRKTAIKGGDDHLTAQDFSVDRNYVKGLAPDKRMHSEGGRIETVWLDR